jgi:outer membrane receptor protein involved in Fe transport
MDAAQSGERLPMDLCRKNALLPLAIAVAAASAPVLALDDFDYEADKLLLLNEIVVTARKREEGLQNSPVAISAFDSRALQELGATNIRDLTYAAPSLQFAEAGNKAPIISIRGIGQRESIAALDPTVGVYLNGIYIPRTDTQLLDTVDTESVQVLRGPQGTLFGKNTTGGALLVTSRSPNTDEFSAEVSTRLGNFGRRDARLLMNIPLAEDTLAMRAAVNSVKSDGYLKNTAGDRVYGDEERLAATARMLWTPTRSFSADFFLYGSKQNENGLGVNCLFVNNPTSNLGLLAYPGAGNTTTSFRDSCEQSEAAAEDRKVSMADKTAFRITNEMAALTLEWDLENIELKSITAYGHQQDIVVEDDQDGSAIEALQNGTITVNNYLRDGGINVGDEERDQLSQEFNLVGTAFDESLSYTLGLFYSYESMDNSPYTQAIGPGTFSVVPGPANGPVLSPHKMLATISDLESETVGLYAQSTYDFTDWFQLTAGARFTQEKRERDARVYSVDLDELSILTGSTVLYDFNLISYGSLADFNAAYQQYLNGEFAIPMELTSNKSGEDSWNDISPAITASFVNLENYFGWDHLDSMLIYATISKGFKSGGLEPKGSDLSTFAPEKLLNYELGTKIDTFDHRLRFNAALYYMDYEDIQVRVAETGVGGITDILLSIANAGEATVAGVELEVTAVPVDNLSLALAFNYVDASYDEYETKEVGQTGSIDRSDEPFGYTPEVTASFTVGYDFITRNVGTWSPSLTVFYQDEMFVGLDSNAPQYEESTLPDYTLLNARLNWSIGRNLNLAAYVDNVADEEYYQGGFAVTQALGAAIVVQGAPRTYGLEASYEF